MMILQAAHDGANKETTCCSSSSSNGGEVTEVVSASTTINGATPPPPQQQEQDTSLPANWRQDVLSALSNVIDPDSGRDIVSLGYVKQVQFVNQAMTSTNNDNNNNNDENQALSVDIEWKGTSFPQNKANFQDECASLLRKLIPYCPPAVTVTLTVQPEAPLQEQQQVISGLAGVKSIIAVSSCKGGVGKSTTAVNLAFALSKYCNKTVGILDADVYGPSLPTMVRPRDDFVQFVGRQIAPLERDGVKLMSFGYINDEAAVMRGPMVTQLLDQFLSVTQWGEHLDYLILDLPPGTGDIQLTLTQRLNITAAVIVTTPQELSFVDVKRGIQMFDSVRVPSIAVVENMAYYEIEQQKDKQQQQQVNEQLVSAFVDKLQQEGISSDRVDTLANDLAQLVAQQQSSEKNDNQRVEIFGRGHKQRLSDQWGIPHTFSMPLLNKIAHQGDSGTPYVLAHDEESSEATRLYVQLARAVIQEIETIQNDSSETVFEYNAALGQLLMIQNNDDKNKQENENMMVGLPAADLRRACRCALCVEEMTGRQLLKPTDIPDSIQPRSMAPVGNYALSIDWSDGHSSLYPYRYIESLLEEQRETQTKAKQAIQKAAEKQNDAVLEEAILLAMRGE